jgi:hypothetical protein
MRTIYNTSSFPPNCSETNSFWFAQPVPGVDSDSGSQLTVLKQHMDYSKWTRCLAMATSPLAFPRSFGQATLEGMVEQGKFEKEEGRRKLA